MTELRDTRATPRRRRRRSCRPWRRGRGRVGPGIRVRGAAVGRNTRRGGPDKYLFLRLLIPIRYTEPWLGSGADRLLFI